LAKKNNFAEKYDEIRRLDGTQIFAATKIKQNHKILAPA
jgi:hypothetical protein